MLIAIAILVGLILQISVTSGSGLVPVGSKGPPPTTTTTYTLTCDPVGGTVPLAQELCDEIAAHPTAMLSPAPDRSTCGEPVGGDFITVTVTSSAGTTSFGGSPFCGWPTGYTIGLYDNAVNGDTAGLAKVEAVLGCGEDPTLLALPTPWPAVLACLGESPTGSGTNPSPTALWPSWLLASERKTVKTVFAGVEPNSTQYYSYERKVVLVFLFGDTTVRVRYDRSTHRGVVTKRCTTVRACAYG